MPVPTVLRRALRRTCLPCLTPLALRRRWRAMVAQRPRAGAGAALLAVLALPAALAPASAQPQALPVLPVPAEVKAATQALGLGRQRLALVVGLGRAGPADLPAARRDAAAVAEALRRVGFLVMARPDVGLDALRQAVREFRDRLEPGGAGLIYVAGSGLRREGRSWLLTRSLAAAEPPGDLAALQAVALPLDELVQALQISPPSLRLLVVDAATPLPGLPAAQQGLAAPRLPDGVMALLSAPPGQAQPRWAPPPLPAPAPDDPREATGSPFGTAFVHALLAAELTGPQVLQQARRLALDATGGAVNPWIGGRSEDGDALGAPRLPIDQWPEAALRRTIGALGGQALEALRREARPGALGTPPVAEAPATAASPTGPAVPSTPAPPPPVPPPGTTAALAPEPPPSPSLPSPPSPPAPSLAAPAPATPAGLAAAGAAVAATAGAAAGPAAAALAEAGRQAALAAAPAALAAAAPPLLPAAPLASAAETVLGLAATAAQALDRSSRDDRAAPAAPSGADPTREVREVRDGLPAAATPPAAAPATAPRPTTAPATPAPPRAPAAPVPPPMNPYGYAAGDQFTYRRIDTWKGEAVGLVTQVVRQLQPDGSMDAGEGEDVQALDPQGRVRSRSGPGGRSQFSPVETFWWARPRAGERRDVEFTETFETPDGRGERRWEGEVEVGEPTRIDTEAGRFEVLPMEGEGWVREWRMPQRTRRDVRWWRTVWYSPELGHPVAVDIVERDASTRLLRRERLELVRLQTSRSVPP